MYLTFLGEVRLTCLPLGMQLISRRALTLLWGILIPNILPKVTL